VESGTDLGHKMTPQDLKYQLLSIKVEENIPLLIKTIKSDEDQLFRSRAFFTLARFGLNEHTGTLKAALSDRKPDAGRLCLYLARANPRKYKDLVLETFTGLKNRQLYSSTISTTVEALALIGGRKAKKALKDYFRQVSEDPDLTTSEDRMFFLNRALYNARAIMKRERICRDLLRVLMKAENPAISIPAARSLYHYNFKTEVRKFFKRKIKDPSLNSSGFDAYGYFLKAYKEMNPELGEFLLKLGAKSKHIPPRMKIRFLETLAKKHDGETQEWLKEMYKNREKNFEEALWILAVYYNDKWIRDKIPKLYKDDVYWTPAGAKRRSFLARAYLVMSNKRSVGFFKRMLSDVNLLKKAYACEGLRFTNARGTKRELKSLFVNQDYSNPRHNAISFQCARALFRFGVRHYVIKLLRVDEIPTRMKQLGLASIGDTGDEQDIELLKHILNKIPPELYDSYMYALVRIARNETDPLMAANQGARDEPPRDSRLLMKEVLKHSDMNFRRKAAGYIEFFTYHWQSIPLLKDCVQSNDPEVKIQGILSFKNTREKSTLGKAKHEITRCFTDPDFRVRTAAAAVFCILENRLKNAE